MAQKEQDSGNVAKTELESELKLNGNKVGKLFCKL